MSEKGQVTIPKALRDRLGIRPGQVLDFDEENGRLVATKVTARDPVDAVWGLASREALQTCYRRRGGQGTRVIADFLIAAHASLSAERLLCRDRGFYRSYFAELAVLDPSAA